MEDRSRHAVFAKAIRAVQRNPERCSSAIVSDLIHGWGNEAWSALEDYLRDCMSHALASSGPVLECGSGLTTIVLGAIAQKRGYRHWALEHQEAWTVRVHEFLARYGIDSVALLHAPLKRYAGFDWYDVPANLPTNFSLVICDGPPGKTHGGRYGLVPLMRDRMASGCVILLDDGDRAGEQSVAQRWEAELGAKAETRTGRRRHFRFVRP